MLLHVPPFWHGEDAHTSTSISHRRPVNPSGQIQAVQLSLTVELFAQVRLQTGEDQYSHGTLKIIVKYSIFSPKNIYINICQ